MAQTRPDENTESFIVKPGKCVDKRVPIVAEREGKYLTQIVKVSQGSLTFRLSTRYDNPGPEGILVDLFEVPEMSNEHTVVKQIPLLQDLPGNRLGWVVATFDNSAAMGWFWNGPEALVEWHWATITASEASATELESVAFLRRIMKDGMANELAKVFAELELMSDDQRQEMVAHMSEDDQFHLELGKVMDGAGIADSNGKVGRAAGAKAGGKTGLVSGVALAACGFFLFNPAVAALPLAVGTACAGMAGYQGGRYVGGTVGQRAGQLCVSPKEAREEGARRATQAVLRVGATGFAVMTAVALRHALLKQFCTVMRTLKKFAAGLVQQLKELHKKWDKSTAEQKEKMKQLATESIQRALQPFAPKLPGGGASPLVARLTTALIFFFMQHISEKLSQSDAALASN